MVKKIQLDDKQYDVSNISDEGKKTIQSLTFVDRKLKELVALKIIINRAKKSYISDLKKEIVSKKAGLVFGDN